jgi:hypothetical protein
MHEENTMSKPIAPIAVPARKPRNPLVAASRFRRAGAHEAGGGAVGQQAQLKLRRELDGLRTHSP